MNEIKLMEMLMNLKLFLALIFSAFLDLNLQLAAAQQAEIKQEVANNEQARQQLADQERDRENMEVDLPNRYTEVVDLNGLANYVTEEKFTEVRGRQFGAGYHMIIARVYTNDNNGRGFTHYFDASALIAQLSSEALSDEARHRHPLNRLPMHEANITYYILRKSWGRFEEPHFQFLCSHSDLYASGLWGKQIRELFRSNGYPLEFINDAAVLDARVESENSRSFHPRGALDRKNWDDKTNFKLVFCVGMIVALLHGSLNNWLASRAGCGQENWNFYQLNLPWRERITGAGFHLFHWVWTSFFLQRLKRAHRYTYASSHPLRALWMMFYSCAIFYFQYLGEIGHPAPERLQPEERARLRDGCFNISSVLGIYWLLGMFHLSESEDPLDVILNFNDRARGNSKELRVEIPIDT